VKSVTLKKQIFGLIFGLGLCLVPTVSFSVEHEDECSKEMLLSYFPEPFVDKTLNRFDVPKEKWKAIQKELAEKDKNILKNVEAKAAKMSHNPLKDPQQRQEAVKIFRETLLENFTAVMKAHGIHDPKKIQSMLDDIQQQKAKQFARCMGGGMPKSSDERNDRDSDDEDEDEDNDDDYDDSEENEKVDKVDKVGKNNKA
jgi:hypothetical protein